MEVAMFSHFSMKITQVFNKPQRKNANEGVRIVHLNPDGRMNSKDEFLQGNNNIHASSQGCGWVIGEKNTGGEGGDHHPLGRPLREVQRS